jgi:ABC-type multidrug transport system ATPase subunit
LENQKKLTALLPRWQEVVRERDFFQSLFAECESLITNLNEQLDKVKIENSKVSEQLAKSPELEILKEASSLAEKAASALKQSMSTALETFKQQVGRENSALSQIHAGKWRPIFTQVEEDFLAAQKEAAEKGAVAEDVTLIPQQLIELEKEISILDNELAEIRQLEISRQTAVKELQGTWIKQTEARTRKAAELMSRLRPSPDIKPYVEIEVYHQGHVDEFIALLEGKIRDRRSLNEEDIRGIVYSIIENSAGKEGSIPQKFVDEVRQRESSTLIKKALDYKDRKKDAFDKAFTEYVLRELETKRISDIVVYKVYRTDGTLAGPIEKVSAGQQGTAILNLLLASGNEPLIIDTPEEGLDNEGVYAELVPLFRREKESRQIVIVTHNANIPVNGDAEGIIALEAGGYIDETELTSILKGSNQTLDSAGLEKLSDLIRWSDWEKRIRNYLEGSKRWKSDIVSNIVSGIGKVRSAEGRIKRVPVSATEVIPAIGALDAIAVKRAVQDIMEGSAVAFRKRREKYGF